MAKKIFNLIILDRSGSMQSIYEATLAGVNETLGTIRRSAREDGVTQLVTFASFCSCGLSYFCEEKLVTELPPFTRHDYQPCCCTPLYDAIGRTCTSLRQRLKDEKDYAVSVTIFTDGYENDSREWTNAAVQSLIKTLKAEGWLFAYIGANQDVEAVSISLSIDNHLSFSTACDADVKQMFRQESLARRRWSRTMADADCAPCDATNSGYFNKLDEDAEENGDKK